MCRSKMIGNYFNDTSIKPCGICDNCINEKNLILSKDEFNNICMSIYKLIEEKSITAKDVLAHLEDFKRIKSGKCLIICNQKIKY